MDMKENVDNQLENAAANEGAAPTSENKEQNVYNLIIIDESGSMMSIYEPALTGMNETLQTIRMAREDHPEQSHYVSLVAFDSNHYNKIYDCIAAENASDITPEQYRPGGCTPLYDAMGRSITELLARVKPGDIVLVTIITDGYENASREYNARSIKSLVEMLKEKGWVFTYIGANQDVNHVAKELSINNCMAFDADIESTRAMFAREKMARKKFFGKIKECKRPEELNQGYFDDL